MSQEVAVLVYTDATIPDEQKGQNAMRQMQAEPMDISRTYVTRSKTAFKTALLYSEKTYVLQDW